MINYQILQLLGLVQRANQLTTGEPLVLKGIRQQTVSFVFIASDAGTSTMKKFTDKCRFYEVAYCKEFSRKEISQAIGQSRSIVAINDTGFAKKFQQLTEQMHKGE
ncbi:ribosomal L7Ae/L30e/S12e/Gadd45 family protein [uncultured Limosilactobacillus sp.]|uniref:L7Ae/L30e/S12e/Gadd45 family ribosomal protein n=1 Tax=uncultured Limosilactobacillus sp. TaxID=2837629 RepID=UPI0025D7098A|nr:ribosomal L7Ae/L30e/S12e/Gadd45 family protein [uncultured Limosilactobacillus sp.]